MHVRALDLRPATARGIGKGGAVGGVRIVGRFLRRRRAYGLPEVGGVMGTTCRSHLERRHSAYGSLPRAELPPFSDPLNAGATPLSLGRATQQGISPNHRPSSIGLRRTPWRPPYSTVEPRHTTHLVVPIAVTTAAMRQISSTLFLLLLTALVLAFCAPVTHARLRLIPFGKRDEGTGGKASIPPGFDTK